MIRHATPHFGIVTALSCEFEAVKATLEHATTIDTGTQGADETYVLGTLPSRRGRHSVVLLLLADMGNNSAGIGATMLSTRFPSVRCIIMTGIAGGVPNPEHAAEHVRCGDIVLSDRNGVVQYDLGKALPDCFISKSPPRPPSARLLHASRMLLASDTAPQLQRLIEHVLRACGWSRPDRDVLRSTTDPTTALTHPVDPQRTPGNPRVFLGTIASANQVLKNPVKRDRLRDEHHVKAVEMEGSGIADATWTRAIEYFVIRGICDYCDTHKNDEWQPYAAVAAAAYTRILLETLAGRPMVPRPVLAAAGVLATILVLPVSALLTRSPPLDGHVYIQALDAPVQVQIDGKVVDELTLASPFTSVDLTPGGHTLLATSPNLHYTQSVMVRSGETVIVALPRAPALPPMGH